MIDILESKVVGTNKETWYKLIGTPDDTKPTGEFPAGTGHTVAKNSTFFEIGTQIKYEFDGSAWAPKGQVDVKLIEKTITEGGIYKAEDDDADGYSQVNVDIPVNDNNAKFISNDADFGLFTIESVEIPYGSTVISNSSFPSTMTFPYLKTIIVPETMRHIASNFLMSRAPIFEKLIINKPKGSIQGAPWGLSEEQIVWTG